MYWVIESAADSLSTDPFQTTSSVGWVVAIGLGVLLGGSGAVAWRQRTRGGTASRSSRPTDEPMAETERPVLTDEERVLRLLESNGGRMRQTAIVEATGWSKSKVSMLLSEMDAEGSISKLRVGRENLISRPGFEPEAARSSLETGT